MKKQKYKTFRDELVELLEKKRMKEFIEKTFYEILLDTAKQLLEKMLNAEIDDYLEYEKNKVNDSRNSRNGYFSKNAKELFGSQEIQTPRDRNASFEPVIIQKKKVLFQVL